MKIFSKIWTLLKLRDSKLQKNPLDKVEFTHYYFKQISEKYPTISYELVEPLTIKAITAKGTQVYHHLDNSFREYQMDLNDLDKILERYITASGNLYKEPKDIDKNRIVPIIKPIDYFEQLESFTGPEDSENLPNLVWEPYNEGLIIVYAEDQENTINYFHKEEFEKLKIEKQDLKELSIRNLEEIVPKIERSGENGSYMLIAGGDYEASLILMTDLWNSDNFAVDGDLVIAIPNRDLVLITGSNNYEQLKHWETFVHECYDTGNHPVSPNFFQWNGERFILI